LRKISLLQKKHGHSFTPMLKNKKRSQLGANKHGHSFTPNVEE